MDKRVIIHAFNVYLKENKNQNQHQTLQLSIVLSIGHNIHVHIIHYFTTDETAHALKTPCVVFCISYSNQSYS